VLARGNLIEMVDLPDRLLAPRRPGPVALAESLDAVERRHIEQVLADSRTLEEAAARLGIDVTTLWRKRKRYGIE
jgi:NtrC-family two-component system response regulator AlgB